MGGFSEVSSDGASTAGGDLHAPAPASASPPTRSDVPLALWPCAQPKPHQPASPVPGAARALLPAQLASRIVTEYTQPGALLVGPACPTLLHQACGCQKVGHSLRAATSRREAPTQMIGGWRYDSST
jgi:hypothetical protein